MTAMRRMPPGAWIGTRGGWLIALAGGVAALVAFVAPWPFAAAAAIVALLGAFGADIYLGRSGIEITREIPPHLALARRDAVRYEVINRGSVALRFGIIETPVARIAFDADEARGAVAERARTTIAASFIPRERGRTAFGTLYVWYETPLGLLRYRWRRALPEAVRIMPDLGQLERGDLALRTRLIDAGLRRIRRRGVGSEFESLRDYAPGDPFRAIDWKATARRGRVMVAQFEVERSQQIVIAIDAGRLMAARLGDRRKLDYAVSAALSIGAIAQLAADRVGLYAFAALPLASVAPGSGAAHAAHLTDVLSDIEPTLDESDYERAAIELRNRYRKRTLLVVFTDLFDPIASATVLGALSILTHQHLVLVVLMNDAAIGDALDAPVGDDKTAYQAAVATTLAAERKRAIARLGERGIGVVDVPAAELTIGLLDAYVEIKTRSLL